METILAENTEHFLKLFGALILGMFLGSERQIAGKDAGIKTHGLVCMGSTLFVLISLVVSEEFRDTTMFDPLRVASHIIVGVGFIGGGAIFMKERSVSGLTTAANLWLAAGGGMAIGFGLYPLAVFVAILTVLTLVIVRGIRLLKYWNLKRLKEKHEKSMRKENNEPIQ